MREVSNIWEAQPINFKPNHSGLKSGRGFILREGGLVLNWVLHGDKTDTTRESLPGPSSLKVAAGPSHSRPPDQPHDINVPKSLIKQIERRGMGEAMRSKVRRFRLRRWITTRPVKKLSQRVCLPTGPPPCTNFYDGHCGENNELELPRRG